MTERETTSCKRVRGRLDAWLDGGLSPLEEALDRGHLEVCEACGAALSERRRMLARVRAAAAPDADDLAYALEGLEARLEKAQRPSPLRAAVRPAVVSILTAAAAVVLLFALDRLFLSIDDALGPPTLGLADWEIGVPELGSVLENVPLPGGRAR